MQDKNKNNVSLPVVNPSPVPSNGQTNPGTTSKQNEQNKGEKNSLPSLGGFKFETKATDVYKRGLIGKGRDFFSLKENSHVEFSKNEDILHNYFFRYINEKKNHWMPNLAGEAIINAQGGVLQISGGESLVKSKESSQIKGVKRLSSNLNKIGTPIKKLSGEIEFKQINILGRSIDQEFHEATSIQKSGRTTLYSTIINTNENLIKIAESSIQHNDSPNTSMIQHSKYDAKTNIDRTQRSYNSNIKGINLLNAPANSSYLIDKYSKKYDIDIAKGFASGLYIPLTQRQLKFDNRTKKQRRLNPLADSNQQQIKKDVETSQIITRKNLNQSPFLTAKEILEQIKHISPAKQQENQNQSQTLNIINKEKQLDIIISHSQTIFQDDQSNLDQTIEYQKAAQTERNQILQNALHLQLGFLEQENQNQSQQHQVIKQKRTSFSLCQTKFDDARAAVEMHPLLHAKMKGPILIDLETIYKMKKAKRYPIPEKMLHQAEKFQLQIDSIIRQAYDDDEIEYAANKKQDIDAPCNSMESNEKIEFYSSFSDEDIPLDQDISDRKNKVKAQNDSEIVQIVKKRKKNKIVTELPPDTKDQRAYEDRMQSIKIHKDAINLQGFDIELLNGFPQNHKEGDIPSFLLKNEKKFAGLNDVQKQIKDEFESKILLPTFDHIQLLFELFCKEFDCQSFPVLKYFHRDILNYQHYYLSLQQVKAICCIIPLIPKLRKIQFCDNNFTDEMSTLIIISAFMNPALTEISIQKNQIKRSAINTLLKLLYFQSNKILELDISGSIQISNNLEKMIYNFGSIKGLRDINGNKLGFKLKSLDLSNIQLSSSACMHVGNILINTQNLKYLNLQGCQISGLGTRYIIDSLNQNIGLQFFNFSHNNMASNVYENAVKIAKIIARHLEMMHYDLTNTCLLREEVIFIGMSLPISRSCIGIHMSGNGLEYYDRVFLRTLIDAKVAYHFKNYANLKNNNNNKQLRQSENNHYNLLENEEQKDDELSQFIRTFNYIEKQKLVLNEELSTVLQESDFLQLFRTIRKGKQKNQSTEVLTKAQSAQQKLVDLINKINERQRLIDNQQKEIQKYSDQNLNLNDPLVIKNLTTMGLYKKIKNEDQIEQCESDGQDEKIININKNQDFKEDMWLMQNALKIERIRQRVQLDALKHIKSKSSAEVALMFTGINKIAYDILMQNPMTAYMTDVVFTRILGNDEIEQGETWRDCTQCWVCEKWTKSKIEFKNEYLGNMRQKIDQIHELYDVLEKCLDSQNHHMLKQIGKKDLSILNNNNRYSKKKFDDDESQKTLSKDRIETQTIQTESDIEIGNEQKLDGNQINPIKLDRAKIEKMLPQNYNAVKSIHRLSPQNQQEITESSDDDLLSQDQRQQFNHQKIQGLPQTPSYQTKSSFNYPKQFDNNHPKFQQAKKLQQNTFQHQLNKKNFKEQEYHIRNSQQYKQESDNLLQQQNFAQTKKQQQAELKIKNTNYQKRVEQIQKRGESSKYKKQDGFFYRLKQKKVYFQGVYHLVDYEVKIDSDEESSAIDTSDDEFKVDSEIVINQFNIAVSKKVISHLANQNQLKSILFQNQPKQFNIFGRKQVFLCASFNDWIPIEMKKIQEIKLERQHGDDLSQFLVQNKDKLEHSKEINNVIQFSNFVPPGRHFFYFVFNNSQIILSSDHQIVKFGDSSVFLNEIEIEQRIELPKKVQLKQNRSNQDSNVFKKERSVFKTYQEDDSDFVHRMMKCDMKYSKIERLCQRSEKADKVVEILEKHYIRLKSIYNYYMSNSTSYPRLSIKDFTQLCYRCKLFDRNLNLVAMERNLVTTNTSINPYKNSEDKELNRYEFLEILVRTAKSKYQDPKIFQSLNDALEILLSKDFMPHCKFLDGVKFRAQYVFQHQVDEIFRKNDQVIKKLFQFCLKLQPVVQDEDQDQIDQKQQKQKGNEKQKQFQVSNKVEKKFSQITKNSTTPEMATPDVANNQIQLSIVNIRELCQRANLNLKVMKINQNFVESLMSRIDTMKDPTLATNMRYAEFLIFIAKIAYDIYQGTKEEEEQTLAQKIDVILEPLLNVAGLQKKFSFMNKEQQSSSEEKNNDSDDD